MLKRIFGLSLAVLLTFSIYASCQTTDVAVTSIGIRINGEYVQTDNFVLGGRTYIPIDTLASSFSLSASFDVENTISLTSLDDLAVLEKTTYIAPDGQSKMISVEKNAMTIIVNGIPLSDDNYFYGGTTYAPLRAITEALDCTVYYDVLSKTARVYTKEYTNFTDDILVILGEDKRPVTKSQFIDLVNFQYQQTPLVGKADEYQDTMDLLFYNLSVEKLAKNLNITISEEGYAKYLEMQVVSETIDNLPFEISDKDAFIENLVKKDYISSLILDSDLEQLYIPSDEEMILEFAKSPYSQGNWMKAQHILVSFGEDDEGYEKAEKILAEIKAGGDFDKLMMENTEDPGSFQQPDGYVFKEGQMVEEFYLASLDLEEGEVSEIVATAYGYHIIKKVADYKNGLPFQMIKDDLVKAYVQSAVEKDFASMRYIVDVVLNEKLALAPDFLEE